MSLIEGGFKRRRGSAKRRARRRRTARAAAPLLVPLALALTLGVIIAVSAGSRPSHVNQTSGTTVTSTPTSSARP